MIQFSLSPDPSQWGSDLSPDLVESDDYIHNPVYPSRPGSIDRDGNPLSIRGFINVGALLSVTLGILILLSVMLLVSPQVQAIDFHHLGHQCWISHHYFCDAKRAVVSGRVQLG